MKKVRVGVYKFTSCDGCQLAFLNAGEALLTLFKLVEVVHFAEAGFVGLDMKVDIAFIEGSISTPKEVDHIKKIRENSQYVVAIGACATAGGIQALRNFANHQEWMANVYATPEYIDTLTTSTAISCHVKVDWELWGCPVSSEQVLDVIRSLLSNAAPRIKRESVCIECKRKGYVCVLVTKKSACMGPVTQTGCHALCPSLGRACYACYGPKETANPSSLADQFANFSYSKEEIAQQFHHINSQAPAFNKAGRHLKGIKIVEE